MWSDRPTAWGLQRRERGVGRGVAEDMAQGGKDGHLGGAYRAMARSRVVLQASGERNFHVFYQLLRGCNEEQRAAHRLRGRPEDYEMLCGGGVLEVAGVDDASDWQRPRIGL